MRSVRTTSRDKTTTDGEIGNAENAVDAAGAHADGGAVICR